MSMPAPHHEGHAPNPERRGVKKGLYVIPSIFTAANIGMGFYAVMAAARGFQFIGTGISQDLLRASAYLDNPGSPSGESSQSRTIDASDNRRWDASVHYAKVVVPKLAAGGARTLL